MPASTASQASPTTAARARSHCSSIEDAPPQRFRARSGVRDHRPVQGVAEVVAGRGRRVGHRLGPPLRQLLAPPGRRAPRVASSTADRAAGVGGGSDERPSTARTSDVGDAASVALAVATPVPSRSRRSGSGRSARTHRVNGQPVCANASRR